MRQEGQSGDGTGYGCVCRIRRSPRWRGYTPHLMHGLARACREGWSGAQCTALRFATAQHISCHQIAQRLPFI